MRARSPELPEARRERTFPRAFSMHGLYRSFFYLHFCGLITAALVKSAHHSVSMADSQRMETARRPEHGSFQKSGLKNMPEDRSYSNQCMHLHVVFVILLNRGSLPIRPCLSLAN